MPINIYFYLETRIIQILVFPVIIGCHLYFPQPLLLPSRVGVLLLPERVITSFPGSALFATSCSIFAAKLFRPASSTLLRSILAAPDIPLLPSDTIASPGRETELEVMCGPKSSILIAGIRQAERRRNI